jgi:hypothetical protein
MCVKNFAAFLGILNWRNTYLSKKIVGLVDLVISPSASHKSAIF